MAEPLTLQARGRSRRRLRVNRLAEAASVAAALVAVGFLAVLVGSVLVRAFHALNWDFFTKGPAVFGQSGGGIAPAFVGTILLVITFVANVLAQLIVRRFDFQRLGAT